MENERESATLSNRTNQGGSMPEEDKKPTLEDLIKNIEHLLEEIRKLSKKDK